MGYLDDIIIYSRSEKEHLEHLEEIFQQTESSRTKTQTRKVLFLQKTHPVSRTLNIHRRNSTPTRETRKHSKNASPQKPKGSETILGLVGYYRKFIPRFADISRVLTQLTKKVEFKWTPECENCFQILKGLPTESHQFSDTQTPSQLHTVHGCIKICIRLCTNPTQ